MPETETEKRRFGARCLAETVQTLDEFADEENLNRSSAIDRVVKEWDEEVNTDDAQEEQSGGAGGMLERIASLRTVTHAVAFLAVALLPLGMIGLLPVAGNLLQVGVLLVVGGVPLLLALLTMWAWILAQIALNRPLTGLFSRGDVADV